MGLDAMISVFWMLSFKPASSLSSFTFIKRFFSSSLSDIRVVSSACLRLLISLPAVLIPACASSSLVFHKMYSAYKEVVQMTFNTLWVLSPGQLFRDLRQIISLKASVLPPVKERVGLDDLSGSLPFWGLTQPWRPALWLPCFPEPFWCLCSWANRQPSRWWAASSSLSWLVFPALSSEVIEWQLDRLKHPSY